MHLKQFAFYAPVAGSSKRSLNSFKTRKRHNHEQRHRRGTGDWVTATIDGQIVSWSNHYTAQSTASNWLGDWITATINGQVQSWPNPYPGQSTTTSAVGSPASSTMNSIVTSSETPSNVAIPATTSNIAVPSVSAGVRIWGRQAYYDAVSGTADGLVFLNNRGGQGSGTWTQAMGNSLSYASSDCQHGAAGPQVLADTYLPDATEAIIYTDKPCEDSEESSCGYYRNGSVAYHGFDGGSKLFLMEFDMPLSNRTESGTNMPAVWILNAAIPRTQQYGNCSCWPGCGEWDIFEILDPGNTRAKSAVHSDTCGEDDTYFERPIDKTMKAAVVFDGVNSSGHIIVLPDDTTFDTSFTSDAVANFGSRNGMTGNLANKVVLGSR